MDPLNCWEVEQCGREPGGELAADLGVCPAAVASEFDGIHQGKNGGRACWVVAGTCCNGATQGSMGRKLADCLQCPFFKQVEDDEGRWFEVMPEPRTSPAPRD